MEFFEGFIWAVPTVFSEAIAKCKFEEGDIIYNSITAYKEWRQAQSGLLFSITVKYPRRTLRVTKGEMASVAAANWDSEVRIELRDLSVNKAAKIITTSQGSLFSVLWKGGVDYLQGNTPTPPLFLKDLAAYKQKKIYETVGYCKKKAREKAHFIMAFDPTNDVSRRKHTNVLSILKNRFGCDLFSLNPKSSGYSDWNRISPVIRTNVYVIHGGRRDEIQKALKDALYRPSQSSTLGGFKIHRHGILIHASR